MTGGGRRRRARGLQRARGVTGAGAAAGPGPPAGGRCERAGARARRRRPEAVSVPGGAGERPRTSAPPRRRAEPAAPTSAPARLVRGAQARPGPGRCPDTAPAPHPLCAPRPSPVCRAGRPFLGAAGRLPSPCGNHPAPVCGLCPGACPAVAGPFLPAAVPPRPPPRPGRADHPRARSACESSGTSPLGSCSGDTPARPGGFAFL